MPNYILSRTSPPAHIYERKINLGYGVKVDVSDAPKVLNDAPTEPNKGKNMNVKEVLDVADERVNPNDDQRGDPTATETPVVQGDGRSASGFDATFNEERIRADLEAQEAEEAKEIVWK